MPPPPPQAGDQFFQRIPDLKDESDVRALYDEWAATYDADLTDATQEYTGPRAVAKAVVTQISSANVTVSDAVVLDAGCGTGLSGRELQAVGVKVIDGIDLSPGMLDRARQTGVYRSLDVVDLSKPIADKQDATYDAVTCVGTFTQGHVRPVPALQEFVRVLKPAGIVVATIREDVWEQGGYRSEVDRLRDEKRVEVVNTDSELYRAGGKAVILILKKL